MSDVQKMQILKSKRDAILDVTTLGIFVTVLYFAVNPEKYDRVTERVNGVVRAVEHRLSVLTTLLSIKSLPETDE